MTSVPISKETIDTLNKASQLNGTLKIMPHEMSITVQGDPGTVIMHAPISEDIPREFNIYDMKLFLKTLSMINEPLIDFTDDNFVVIHNEDNSIRTVFHDAAAEFIQTYIDPSRIPDLEDVADVRFTLPAEKIDTVVKAARSLGRNYIGFRSDGSTLVCTAFNLQDSGEKTESFDVALGSCDVVFDSFYKLEVTAIHAWMGEGDLTVKLSRRGVSCIDTDSGKRFLTVLHTKSTFE